MSQRVLSSANMYKIDKSVSIGRKLKVLHIAVNTVLICCFGVFLFCLVM